jgi:hypothetical protein
MHFPIAVFVLLITDTIIPLYFLCLLKERVKWLRFEFWSFHKDIDKDSSLLGGYAVSTVK